MATKASIDNALLNAQSQEVDGRKILLTCVSDFPGPLAALVEIAKWSMNKGDEVYIGLWASKTKFSDTCSIVAPWLARVLRVETPQESVKRLLQNFFLDNDRVHFVDLSKQHSSRYHIARGSSISIQALQAKSFKYYGESYSIGASLVDGTRKSLATASFRSSIVSKLQESYECLVDEVVKIVDQYGIDTVIAFNGRRAHDHAVLTAAEKSEAKIQVYEMGATSSHIDLYSHGTHDRKALQKRMQTESLSISDYEREEAGNWFHNRANHLNSDANRFISKQQIGKSLDPLENKKDIVYFVSSLDELASIGPEWNSPFGTQETALALIHEFVSKESEFRLVIREHPFMGQMDRRSLRKWRTFLHGLNGAVLVRADSRVDTYKLIQSAYAVISFGSTTGVEASFMGVPTILIGPSFYDDLGVCSYAQNKEELYTWLLKPSLPETSADGCISYANFMLNRGKLVEQMTVLSPLHASSTLGTIGVSSTWKRIVLTIENRLRRSLW